MDSMNPNPARQLAQLGKAIKGLGPAVAPQQSRSVNEQMARSVLLTQRRGAFRARMAAIRYRVEEMGLQPQRQHLAERVARHARTDRYLRNAGLTVGVLAILAGLAFIATSGIGGGA